MSWLEVVVWAIVGFWLIVTVVYNLPGVTARLGRWDWLSLLPIWTFFAPNPGRSDLIFLARDQLPDGTYTRWRAVNRSAVVHVRGVWNPDKRGQKLITDAAAEVLYFGGSPAVVRSTGFLLLARIAEDSPHDFRAVRFQFTVINVSGWWLAERSFESAFRSPLLRLARG